MGAAALGTYKLVMFVTGAGFVTNLIATVLAIGVAVVVYFALVFALKVMSPDEVKQLPAGNKIYALLVKTRLYR